MFSPAQSMAVHTSIITPKLSIICLEVLYLKKNPLSDDSLKKGTRGFYAALGISAVMIGSACFFAYGQNDTGKELSSRNTVVDKKSDGVPKTTSYRYTVTTSPASTTAVVTTAPVTTKLPEITLPAAQIVTDIPVVTVQEEVQVSSNGLTDVKLPLAGECEVLEPFSAHELVKNPTTGAWQTHNGTDYKAEVGAAVYAVAAGEITKVENDALWGTTVTLDHHNGYVTKYCGLGSALSVQEGDSLASGDIIGAAGNTADIESSGEPHLHIEITRDGSFIDPESLLK